MLSGGGGGAGWRGKDDKRRWIQGMFKRGCQQDALF